MTLSKEIVGGEWYGVSIPPWLRCFDCRMSEEEIFSDQGIKHWASERAAIDLGLRPSDPSCYADYHDTTPHHCQTYIDSRTCPESMLVQQVKDMVTAAIRLYEDYQLAKANPAKPGDGGSCFYLPVAIALSNYGWSVICDDRTCVVKGFDR